MQASRLAGSVATLGALLASPRAAVAQQTGRHTIAGDNVAIYNLVGVMRVEAGLGSDVVVELTRGGADAGRLRVEAGGGGGRGAGRGRYPPHPLRGRGPH